VSTLPVSLPFRCEDLLGSKTAVIYHTSLPPKPTTICLKPACVLAASEIIENLSPRYDEIDPCTDFNKYVCEGFDEKHDL